MCKRNSPEKKKEKKEKEKKNTKKNTGCVREIPRIKMKPARGV